MMAVVGASGMAEARRAVRVNGVEFGGAGFVIIAGPCAVESEEQILRTARAVAAAGAKLLRGGAFKPRTSPYSFQGLETNGLQLLDSARRETGLRIVTEVMSVLQLELVADYADMLQIGSRSMANQALLEESGRTGLPVLLKRGMMATHEEFAEAAEILAAHGCPGVVLCERGIRTFGHQTRNTCDIAAIPLLQRMTGLPVIVDPSHATGRSDLVVPVSKAAVAIGADGLIVEVHPEPAHALSDGNQSLSIPEFRAAMDELAPHLRLWHETRRAGLTVS
jgi:3-deoxy-7-phosphoheptulonate synthase